MSQEDFPPTFDQQPYDNQDSVAGNEYHIDLRGEGGTSITVVGGGEPVSEANPTPIVDTLPKQYEPRVATETGAPTREVGGGHGGTVRQLGLSAVRRAVAPDSQIGIRAFADEHRRSANR